MARNHWRKSEAGQAMVEFALVLPLLVVFLCAIIDFGWIFYHQIAINNACREGARYAAIHYVQEDQTTLLANTSQYVNDSAADIPSLVISLTYDAPQSLTVTVQKDVPVLTGITSLVLGPDVNLTASSTMRIEN